MNRRTLFFVGPRRVSVQSEAIPALNAGEVLIHTRLSAISPGTELLIYRDQAPKGIDSDATIEALRGEFIYPFKYGYSNVGEIIQLGPQVDEQWIGRTVFAFNPHESHFTSKIENLQPLPENVSVDDAVFLPNVETATNFVMDGKPLIGEKVAIVGQGIVGLLTTALLARFPLAELVSVDQHEMRRAASLALGATQSMDAGGLQKSALENFDLIYELSGAPEALNMAIALAGFESRIVIGSWYGEKKVQLDLGGQFHRQRIKLISSQVSTVAAELSGRWDKARRMNLAWHTLAQVKPSQFITQRFHLSQAKEAYQLLDENPQAAIQVVFDYD